MSTIVIGVRLISERFKLIRAKLVKNQEEMAEALGISGTAYQNYEQGKSVPGGKVIEKLIKLGVDANWLLTGNEMAIKYTRAGGEGERNQVGEEIYQLPIFDVQAAAGDGREIIEERVVDHFPVKLTWIKQALRLNPVHLVVISARGDSMEPTLRNEDLIIIDKSQFEVLDDAIYIVNMEGLLMVKRLQRLLGGRLCIKSDNPAYQDQMVERDQLEQVHVIGRVVWVGRRM